MKEYRHITENNLSLYLNDAKKERLLTREEEIDIVQKVKQGDEAARTKLIKSNIRFVISIAKKYQNNGIALEDLISEGNVGLVIAADRFEPDKGYHFISYAVYWIKQSILKAINEKSRLIRLPLNKANDLIAVERIIHNIYYKEGKEPDVEQIADILNKSKEDIAHLINISGTHISLNAESIHSDSDESFGDIVEDKKNKQPEQKLIDNDLSSILSKAIAHLTEAELKIITYRYGLDGNKPKTLKEIGQEFNLTKERIRQIEKRALKKMRHISVEDSLIDFME